MGGFKGSLQRVRREVERHGGREQYSATAAAGRAAQQARRAECCKLADDKSPVESRCFSAGDDVDARV